MYHRLSDRGDPMYWQSRSVAVLACRMSLWFSDCITNVAAIFHCLDQLAGHTSNFSVAFRIMAAPESCFMEPWIQSIHTL